MKPLARRLLILVVIILISLFLFNTFCSVIEVPPFVVLKTPLPEFTPAEHKKGLLVLDPIYQQIPILILRGSPAELGEQQGVLLKPQLTASVDKYLGRFLYKERKKKKVDKAMKTMTPFIPQDYEDEIQAMSVNLRESRRTKSGDFR